MTVAVDIVVSVSCCWVVACRFEDGEGVSADGNIAVLDCC